jgi:CHAT domain-containing protein
MLEPCTRARTDALSRSLAAVFEDLPEAVSELRLRPDDALHGFPFAAMPVKGAPAIEKYTIGIRQTGAPPEMRKGEPTEAVVLAAGAGEGGYAELPNAVEEVKGTTETLSRLGFRVRAATGAARKSDATDALEKAALVHVVCHGRFQPDQPSQTGLVLAGPDGSAETLSITEIGRMNCKRLEHVTLSACWSADNFVVPGRWIFSLPETFCRAGAGSVLASLWEADDRVAPAFMQRFYRNCANMTRAQALRDSQLACLGNTLCPGVVTSDPVYWANFYLFGESGRLRCN